MPLSVSVRVTGGRAASLRIWLDDGASETLLTVAGGLAYTGTLQLGVVPRQPGRARLWATVKDAQGCSAQTGAVRFVDVVQ